MGHQIGVRRNALQVWFLLPGKMFRHTLIFLDRLSVWESDTPPVARSNIVAEAPFRRRKGETNG